MEEEGRRNKMGMGVIQSGIGGPPVLAENRNFLVKIAETEGEIEQALRLRYEVFKLEQGRMAEIDESIDRDEFDEYCSHLLVIDRMRNRVVGTYRMQSGSTAVRGIGFYSEREYEIAGLREIADEVFEVGRSCVAPEYRTGAVVAMLWAGIAEVRHRANFRYMLGCVSLEHTRADVGWAIHDDLMRRGLVEKRVHGVPRSEYVLPRPDEKLISAIDPRREFPPLFKGYLRIGARICGAPALDRDFGSIDYLIWFDFLALPDKYVKHFNV